MSAIVQSKAATITEPTQTSLSLTFDNPVAAGNLIVVGVVAYTGTTDPNVSLNCSLDDGVNNYQSARKYTNFNNLFQGEIFYVVASQNRNTTIVANFTGGNGNLAFNDAAVHAYEVTGYDTLDQTGIKTGVTTNEPATVSTDGRTAKDNEFVFALFVTGGVTGTWSSTNPIAESVQNLNDPMMGTETFSFGYETNSEGVQDAEAFYTVPSVEFNGIIATFCLGALPQAPPPPPPTGPLPDPPFFGTVRVVDSAPAGAKNPFIGTVTVINSNQVPTGTPMPYLGQVVDVVSVPNGDNPVLGYVLIADNAPAGDSDPFLGSVISVSL
jgi:hypothetical protein